MSSFSNLSSSNSNLHEFLYSVEHKIRFWRMLATKVDGTHWLQYNFFYAMEVNVYRQLSLGIHFLMYCSNKYNFRAETNKPAKRQSMQITLNVCMRFIFLHFLMTLLCAEILIWWTLNFMVSAFISIKVLQLLHTFLPVFTSAIYHHPSFSLLTYSNVLNLSINVINKSL